MEPFNIKIQNTTQGAGKPNNQEVTQNADGSGGPISIAKKIKPSIFHKGIVAKFIVKKPINESGRIFANRLSETFAVISNT